MQALRLCGACIACASDSKIIDQAGPRPCPSRAGTEPRPYELGSGYLVPGRSPMYLDR